MNEKSEKEGAILDILLKTKHLLDVKVYVIIIIATDLRHVLHATGMSFRGVATATIC